ncbi:MAG: hypothetical protein KKA07_03365 [Bacteroidetes bacterium]|nr:hypothetical protein [Bacteroidota bacterium]MBU1718091.1 hypothetical protein [Bacteroidota bacterium]
MKKVKSNLRLMLAILLVAVLVLPEISCQPSRGGYHRRTAGSSRKKGGTPCMNWSHNIQLDHTSGKAKI